MTVGESIRAPEGRPDGLRAAGRGLPRRRAAALAFPEVPGVAEGEDVF